MNAYPFLARRIAQEGKNDRLLCKEQAWRQRVNLLIDSDALKDGNAGTIRVTERVGEEGGEKKGGGWKAYEEFQKKLVVLHRASCACRMTLLLLAVAVPLDLRLWQRKKIRHEKLSANYAESPMIRNGAGKIGPRIQTLRDTVSTLRNIQSKPKCCEQLADLV